MRKIGKALSVVLVANPSAEHLGSHLKHAAEQMGVPTKLADLSEAFDGPHWLQRLYWHFLGHRPIRLSRFNDKVLGICQEEKPDVLIATGIAPITAQTLRTICNMGTRCINYLTDDPWNQANEARHFWPALREYDVVFSTKRANLEELRQCGCKKVIYLPFAYAPKVHYPVESVDDRDRVRFECDVAFAGGADSDRARVIKPLIDRGYSVRLFGAYWDRYPDLRPFYGGFAKVNDYRKVAALARISLCMGRKANRDGHAMRSFELPAMGACMLVEDTEEHRELFGPEGEAVLYWNAISEMVDKVQWLLDSDEERTRMRAAVQKLINSSRHTYADRLKDILGDI